MFAPFIQGLGLGGGLIIAIGAQNAFVLSQGVKRNHHLAIATTCFICDAVLITISVSGVGAFIASSQIFSTFSSVGGALFLLFYGARSLKSAIKGGQLNVETSSAAVSLRSAVLAALAVTLLNPHVYLDTIILLGGISSRFSEEERGLFGMGAMAASFIWFFGLSLFGYMLAPLFAKRTAWRILDGSVCLVMWAIALSLIGSLFNV